MFFFVLRNGYFCGDLDIPKEARSHKNVGRQFDHGSKFQTLPPTPKQFSLEAWREFLMEQEDPDIVVLQMHNYLKYGRRGETDVSDRRKNCGNFLLPRN